MKTRLFSSVAALALGASFALAAPAAHAEDPAPTGLFERDTLTGDWGGLRTQLIDHGVTLGLKYTGEVWGVASGGIHTGGAADHQFLATGDFDFGKMAGLSGLTGHVSGFAYLGHSASWNQLRNAMDVSNTDVYGTQPGVHERLWTLWLQQASPDGLVSVRAGQLSADDEFWVTTTAANLLNTTFLWNMLELSNLPAGLPADSSGAFTSNGDAYPLGAPGIRLQINPTDKISWLAAVMTHQPESIVRGGAQFKVTGDKFVISELQYLVNQAKDATGLPAMYKIGGWYDTGKFTDYSHGGITSSGNAAIYGLVDQTFIKTPDFAISAFLRGGVTPDDSTNIVSEYVDGGIGITGLIPGRSSDVTTLGVAYAGASDALKKFQRAAGSPVISDYEMAIELSYTATLAPWWTLQPDVQYVIHPGYGQALSNFVPTASPSARVDDGLVFGLRTSITF